MTMSRCSTLLLGLLSAALLGGAGGTQPSSAITSERQQVTRERAGVDELVAAAIAGNYELLRKVADELRARPRPPHGNRPVAREMNERGLALWRRQRFEEAAVYFAKGHHADPGDAEIAENLGYALLKSGWLEEAERAILTALTLAPERASAWGSLGMLRAKAGRHREGVACVLTAYRFVRDRERTLEVYSRLAATDEDPRVRALLVEAVSRISQGQGPS